MASVSTVVTMGFGSFGSVNLLPTIGYGIGAAATVIAGPCWAAGEVYASGLQEADVFEVGYQQGEAYTPGFATGEREC